MATALTERALSLNVRDFSGQRCVRAAGVAPDTTVGELIDGLVPKMGLPTTDTEGRPLAYHARLEREGRHLHHTERVGDALRTDDQIDLHVNIMAGAC